MCGCTVLRPGLHISSDNGFGDRLSHLEYDFDVRNGTKPSCPQEIGYVTTVAVLTVNKGIEKGRKIEFKAKDFEV